MITATHLTRAMRCRDRSFDLASILWTGTDEKYGEEGLRARGEQRCACASCSHAPDRRQCSQHLA